MGKDFGIFPGGLDDAFDPVRVVGVVNGGAIDDGILAVAVVVGGHQRSLRSAGVEPLGEEQIDLVNVLFEGGVAGRVVLDVIGGAQTFAGVQGDFRGLAARLAAGGARVPGATQEGFGQGFVVVLGDGQQQLRQVLIAEDVEDENGQNERGEDGGCVEDAAQALPTLSLGVEKYLLIRHRRSCFHLGENRGNGLRYTVRIVWKLTPRVNRRRGAAELVHR